MHGINYLALTAGIAFWTSLPASAHTSPRGTRLTTGCIDIVRKHSWPADPATVIANFDSLIDDTWQEVTRCQAKYPELSGYFDDWFKKASSSYVTCIDELSSDADEGGHSDVQAGAIAFPIDVFQTIFASTQKSILVGATASVYRPWAIAAILHEVLHASSAEVLSANEHNRIERIGYGGAPGSCGEDVTQDRISVITALCSGPNWKEEQMLSWLHYRDALCPQQGDCKQLFTQKMGLFAKVQSHFEPSEPLPSDLAARLCKRIDDLGQCSLDRSSEVR